MYVHAGEGVWGQRLRFGGCGVISLEVRLQQGVLGWDIAHFRRYCGCSGEVLRQTAEFRCTLLTAGSLGSSGLTGWGWGKRSVRETLLDLDRGKGGDLRLY